MRIQWNRFYESLGNSGAWTHSHWIKISIDFRFNCGSCKWREPCQWESTKYWLNTFPTGLSRPAGLLFFQLFDTLFGKCQHQLISIRAMQSTPVTYRFIIPNCVHLWAEHNECEHSKQQCFKCQEQQENHCGRWRKERALFPFIFDALCELIYGQEHCMRRYHRNVKLLNGFEQGNELQLRQCLFDSLTVNRTKYFWLFSPTQLFTLKIRKENENKSNQ